MIYIYYYFISVAFRTHMHDANLPDLVNESAGHIPRLCYMRSKMDNKSRHTRTHAHNTASTHISKTHINARSNMCPPWIITTGWYPLHWAVPFIPSFSLLFFLFSCSSLSPQWTFPLHRHQPKMPRFERGGNEWLKSTTAFQLIATWKQLTVSLFFQDNIPIYWLAVLF